MVIDGKRTGGDVLGWGGQGEMSHQRQRRQHLGSEGLAGGLDGAVLGLVGEGHEVAAHALEHAQRSQRLGLLIGGRGRASVTT